ncbi:hypothetical protein FRC19_004006 [Serendipita sp. 401]|nr:hypothetical protein FRC19_004006 [Serendipita sp. 401]
MKPFYYGFTLVNINLWIWSSVFHTRDKPWTEKMDYFSAGLGSMYGLWYTVVRLYHLYLQPRLLVHNTPSRRRLLAPWTSLCILLYLAHVTYLCLLPRFDYGWNMKVNLIIGMLYNFLWISYSLPSPPFQRFWRVPNVIRPSFVLYPAMIAISMICAVSLEIFDFPPWWRIIDAHSLWHLATVPIVWNWYRFLLTDSLDPSWRDRLIT